MNKYAHRRFEDIYFTIAAIWCILGFVFHIAMIRKLVRTGDWLAVLAVLAVWWAITLLTERVRRLINKRNKEKEETELREYRERYIRELTVEDTLFGRVVLEHDRNKNTVGAEEYRMERPFGRHEDLLLTAEIDGDDATPIAASLTYLYRNSRDVLEMMYKYALECCENYEERNSDGEPYDIDYVRSAFFLYGITIVEGADCIYVSLDGSINGDDGTELLGCHGITLDIELTKSSEPRRKRISCGLVG